MQIDFMRNLDERLGEVLVNFVRVISLFARKPKNPDPSLVKDILFIKFFGGGSLILTTPMLRGLKRVYGGSTIHLLTFRENYDLCKRLPGVDEVIVIRNNTFITFIGDVVMALIHLWKIRPSIVLDGEFFSNFTSLFAWLCPAKVRVGFHERQVPRGEILTHPVSLNIHKHMTFIFYSLAVALGAKYDKAECERLDFQVPDEAEIQAMFSKTGVDPEASLVVVNPNAGPLCLLRRWPAGHFVSLVVEMARKHPDQYFLLIGSKSEAPYVNGIAEKINLPNVINTAGTLSVAELCALIFKADLVITNDSMPLHIAAAYGKPLVCFFGPETPRIYGPRHPNSLVFFDDIPCSPCLNTFDNKVGNNCTDNICLRVITPDRVMREIERFRFDRVEDRVV